MRSHTQNKGAQGIDAAMALKGLLVLILGIVVTYLAATFVVTTGGMIMAAAAGERVFAMSSTQFQPFANALLARYPRWVSAARYAVTFIPFALWARALRRRASQDAGGAPEKPAVRFGAGVLRGKDVATLVMVAVGLHGLSALIATMVGAAMPWLLESYGKIVDQSGLEAYGADWFLSLIFGAPVVEETIFRGLGFGYLRASGMRRGLANGMQALFFGIFHGNLFQAIYATVLGMFLGDICSRYNALAASMLVHAMVNIASTVGSSIITTTIPGHYQWLLVVAQIAVLVAAYRRLPQNDAGPLADTAPR